MRVRVPFLEIRPLIFNKAVQILQKVEKCPRYSALFKSNQCRALWKILRAFWLLEFIDANYEATMSII
jgi:hypothetical protein